MSNLHRSIKWYREQLEESGSGYWAPVRPFVAGTILGLKS
jgi:hypothetical protein